MRIYLFIILVCTACAQSDIVDEEGNDEGTPQGMPQGKIVCPVIEAPWRFDAGDTPLSRVEQVALTDRFNAELSQAEAAWNSAPPEDCASSAGVVYARGLAVRGDADACLAFVESCLKDRSADATAGIAFIGATCAATERRIDRAIQLFERGTSKSALDGCQDGRGRAYAYAAFAVRLAPKLDVAGILSRAEGWDVTAAERAVRTLTSSTTSANLDELLAWMSTAARGDSLLGQQLALAWNAYLDRALGQDHRALRMIEQNLDSLGTAGLLHSAAPWFYMQLYSISAGDLTVAQRAYDGYAPFVGPHGWLPTEHNTRTYGELYAADCRNSLLSGAARTDYQKLRDDWIAGAISTPAALAEVRKMLDGGDRAELLSLYGAILEAHGDTAAAASAYFRSHQACKYYDRAHWALSQIDLATRLRRGNPLAYNPPATDALDRYVINYASLSDGERAGLRYGLRIFLPYLEVLISGRNALYAKRPFELLSDTPGMSGLRDARITYAGDYRLWDDVRGAGGNPVIADISEVVLAPYGAYNLAGHEVAHQLHAAAPTAIDDCIQALYAAAKARGIFVSYYASYNKEEYFAVGVDAFTLPVTTPASYGTNRQWLRDHDADLDALLAQFDSATALDDIECPIAIPDELYGQPRARPSHLWRRLHGTTQYSDGRSVSDRR